jgi:hypothetical protein
MMSLRPIEFVMLGVVVLAILVVLAIVFLVRRRR